MPQFYDVPINWKDGSQTRGVGVGNNAAWLCACGQILLGPHEGLYKIDPCPKCQRSFKICRGQQPQYVGHVEEI